MPTNDKVNGKNIKSPQRCEGTSVSGYNTPVRKKQITNNTQESPDLDYLQSPILFPCTQESATEVAWDWQSSLNKTPESRNKKRNTQFETPKRAKLLQKKRNSNSPLLYKPLKKKTVKMESIENIGQFSAELQALNEQMRHIKQSNTISFNVDVKEEEEEEEEEEGGGGGGGGGGGERERERGRGRERDKRHRDREEKMVLASRNTNEEVEDQQNCIGETNDCNNSKNDGSYDDLFDDSVDECMIRCTQEMEEKFKLIADKENSMSSDVITKKEPHHSSNVDKTCTNFTCNENSKVSPKHTSYKGTNNSAALKTGFSLRRRSLERNTAVQKDKNLYRTCLNNNDTMTHSHVKKICDNSTSVKSNTTELFGDDSFDDCLATCIEDEKVEDEKVLSSSTVCDKFSTRQNNGAESDISYKYLPQKLLKSEATSANSLKTAIQTETSASSSFQHRKFFKTKSLSDHLHSIKTSTITNSSITSASASFDWQYEKRCRKGSDKQKFATSWMYRRRN
ncbi:TRAF3-interacting protein 1-like isoform X2 [Pseudomyrmex gracilis]|uniref:TRAF3-interacting protein 1-like isoform X2 n=1 Tax=Pseudomyrmex gracilis TaxID=219809 RepID=UPI000994BF8E|nr:TRAF3-interacting protein 1-like isoform X2 [Pseudomyrmex gracilis]